MPSEDCITMAHGAGGRASADLIETLFIPAFGRLDNAPLQDSAALSFPALREPGSRLAFTTDSYVVSPLVFPGGDIGKLAVCGTVNDLSVSGAIPAYLSAAFILEEGLPISVLSSIVKSMADTAKQAGVKIVTGDTKVVEKGQADGIFINTSGVGVIPATVTVRSNLARVGDAVLVNGFIGDHGAAIMLARQELGLAAEIASDCAPLNAMIAQLLEACPELKVMRDATRGGVGTVLAEIAQSSGVTIALDEERLPVRLETQAICELLGMDPLFFANEGLLVCVLPEIQAEAALTVMRKHPFGQQAEKIGRVTESQQSLLYINTSFGSKRMLEPPYGIQLPRIC
ncbi:MAG: hydrogenase expression/formation protein HypE [Aestuariibacter sp.]